MMRTTFISRHMMSRNAGVAPKFDTWSDKYDAWRYMRRMSKLVGTGFYIAPNWYHHFRMFPPQSHSFKQEHTENPYAVEEPTQEQFDSVDSDRRALRDELARRSRSLASAGMRYFNIFWVKKPLDDAERRYFALRRGNAGLGHDDAMKQVLSEFYQKQALRRRSHMIQAEEAQMTGKFLTMREAMSVVQLLGDAQKMSLAPHQFAELAQSARSRTSNGETTVGASRTVAQQSDANKRGETMSAEALHAMLSGSGDASAQDSAAGRTTMSTTVVVEDAESDSVSSLKNISTGSTGSVDWFDDAAEGKSSSPHSPKVSLGKE